MAFGALCLAISVLATPVIVFAVREPVSQTGTTPNIHEVFIGRCWDYDVTRFKGLLPRVEANCDTLWDNFEHGFRYKKPCDVSMSSYELFLHAANQDLPVNKVMFWSGVYKLAHDYSDAARKYVTLEDTMIGYLVNSLNWCGQQDEPGINFDKCPTWNDCKLEASESFWAGASTMYAKMASGEVTLMLGGSDPERKAYRRSSFFGKYELPNLSNVHVTKIKAIVTHVLEKPKFETCESGSLLDLRADVEDRGFPFECVDDPQGVMHLLCADDPKAVECRLAQAHARGELEYPSHNDNKASMNSMPVDHFNA